MSKIKTCIGCYSYGTSDDMSDCWKCNDYSYYEEDDEFTELKKQIRTDAIDEIATRLEAELLMVMPRDKVKFIMYKVHTVLEQLKKLKGAENDK